MYTKPFAGTRCSIRHLRTGWLSHIALNLCSVGGVRSCDAAVGRDDASSKKWSRNPFVDQLKSRTVRAPSSLCSFTIWHCRTGRQGSRPRLAVDVIGARKNAIAYCPNVIIAIRPTLHAASWTTIVSKGLIQSRTLLSMVARYTPLQLTTAS